MSRTPDVLFVGGGIVGLCAALAAADRGLHVAVVDDNRPGAASPSSAGMLGPSLPGLPESVRDLALTARDLYPEVVVDLASRSGVRIALDRSGILEIATSASELEDGNRGGVARERLDQQQLAELEPALRAHAGAVHHPRDGWVDNRALMEALWISVERDPRIQVMRDRVESVDVSRTGALVMLSNNTRIESLRLVVAIGAWSALAGLRRRISVRPVKGELLTLDRCPVRHVVYGDGGYVIPRGHSTIVGATSEEASFDTTPTAAGRKFLLGVASALVPTLSDASVFEHWAGIRPVSPDGLPILGEDVDTPALVYACGFSRNGVLLAPWAGRALSAMLSGEKTSVIPPEFSPARIGEINNRS